MHRVNQALIAELANLAPNTTDQFVLTAAKSPAFESHLERDSIDYYYSAVCTYLESISGLYLGNFAWATVRLYYSCFYSARSILGANNIAIFYNNKKAYSIKITQNSSPTKESGTTHEIAFKVINKELSIPELKQPIDGIPPFEWLKEKREEANYKIPKLYDPEMPSHFNYTSSESLTRSINAYIDDINSMRLALTYDKDHAVVAYPLICLKKAKERLNTKGISLADPDISYLASIIPPALPALASFLL